MFSVLREWGAIEVVGPLGGGQRNHVIEIRRGGQPFVARQSRREGAALEWELDLLDFLSRHGFTVPTAIPCLDGRRHVHGVVVQRWLEGRPPTPGDWSGVAVELARLHRLTQDWPQRPGFCSSTDLLIQARGGDVDLSTMPATVVEACRAAWNGIVGVPKSVVHGDPSAANIRVSGKCVGILDWDEARVDHVDLDLAAIPGSDLPQDRLRQAQAALNAWEAANGWTLEPDYARRRLAELSTSSES